MISESTLRRIAEAAPGAVVVCADLEAPSELLVSGTTGQVERLLAEEGFLACGQVWARLGGVEVEACRVRTHDHQDELVAAGRRRPDGLVEAAPAHRLLLAAERLAADPSVESALVAAEASAALRVDPEAWRAALRRGLDWGLWRALAHLERALAGATITPDDRADASRELRRTRSAPVEWTRVPPAVVAVSGVDGAGKSVQCRALQAALVAAGVPCAVEWTRVAADRRLDAIARPVIAVLRRVRGGSPRVSRERVATSGGTPAPPQESAGRSLRARSRALTVVWAYVVMGLAVAAQRTSSRLHRRQGRVVIRDRYLLDAVVQLRDDYGVRCGRLARAVLTRLAPRPAASFLLLVAPEVARRRKPEQFDVADLRRLTEGYLRAAEELAVTVVDGEQEPSRITAQLFDAVWRDLAQTSGASRASRTG